MAEIISTIGTGAQDYPSLTAWEAAIPADTTDDHTAQLEGAGFSAGGMTANFSNANGAVLKIEVVAGNGWRFQEQASWPLDSYQAIFDGARVGTWCRAQTAACTWIDCAGWGGSNETFWSLTGNPGSKTIRCIGYGTDRQPFRAQAPFSHQDSGNLGHGRGGFECFAGDTVLFCYGAHRQNPGTDPSAAAFQRVSGTPTINACVGHKGGESNPIRSVVNANWTGDYNITEDGTAPGGNSITLHPSEIYDGFDMNERDLRPTLSRKWGNGLLWGYLFASGRAWWGNNGTQTGTPLAANTTVQAIASGSGLDANALRYNAIANDPGGAMNKQLDGNPTEYRIAGTIFVDVGAVMGTGDALECSRTLSLGSVAGARVRLEENGAGGINLVLYVGTTVLHSALITPGTLYFFEIYVNSTGGTAQGWIDATTGGPVAGTYTTFDLKSWDILATSVSGVPAGTNLVFWLSRLQIGGAAQIGDPRTFGAPYGNSMVGQMLSGIDSAEDFDINGTARPHGGFDTIGPVQIDSPVVGATPTPYYRTLVGGMS